MASEDFQKALHNTNGQNINDAILSKIAGHKHTIEVSVGSGPMPHGPASEDPTTINLIPLLAQMVVNHLLNMNPANAIYWGSDRPNHEPESFFWQ